MNEREITAFETLCVGEGYLAERRKLFGESALVIRAEGKKSEEREKERLSSTLKALGFLPNLSGTAYLLTAVTVATYGEGLPKPKMKEVYKAVAKKYATTPERVEKAIRHALFSAWNRSGAESFNFTFGKNVFKKNLSPTSSELICLLAEKQRFL